MCLLYVIDMSQADPFYQLQSLKYEVDQYNPGLSNRPCGIVANKMDLLEAQENLSSFTHSIEGEGSE